MTGVTPRGHLPRLVLAAACILGLSFAGLGFLSAQASPSPITFSSGSWQLTLGGYFKLDLIHDFDANSSPDSFDPRSIPVDSPKGTNTRIHARETRLSLGIEGPAKGRHLKLFLEGDFYGTGNAFRLRHAYAQYGVLLAGQTWTTVMDADNIPPTIDFETPLAAPFVRQGLLRVTTGLSRRSDLALTVGQGLAALLGDRLSQTPISSLKPMLGHCLGASGAVEAVAAVLALERGIVPPTLGTIQIDPELPACKVATRVESSSARQVLILAESFAGRCAAMTVSRG